MRGWIAPRISTRHPERGESSENTPEPLQSSIIRYTFTHTKNTWKYDAVEAFAVI
jgi:hypothetical protein